VVYVGGASVELVLSRTAGVCGWHSVKLGLWPRSGAVSSRTISTPPPVQSAPTGKRTCKRNRDDAFGAQSQSGQRDRVPRAQINTWLKMARAARGRGIGCLHGRTRRRPPDRSRAARSRMCARPHGGHAHRLSYLAGCEALGPEPARGMAIADFVLHAEIIRRRRIDWLSWALREGLLMGLDTEDLRAPARRPRRGGARCACWLSAFAAPMPQAQAGREAFALKLFEATALLLGRRERPRTARIWRTAARRRSWIRS